MKRFILKLIKIYQKLLSPDHGVILAGTAMRCRFYPSCSQYTYEAVERYGIGRGLFRSLARVVKCGPWSRGGYDPVIRRTAYDS